jgi:mycothiol synthase
VSIKKFHMSSDQIVVVNSPPIPELKFRHFRGPGDYHHWASVLTSSECADKNERQVTSKNIASAAQHLTNCDAYQDMIFAEIAYEVVGYARGWWWDETATGRLYGISGFLVPEWRHRGIGRAMHLWMEQRMRMLAAIHPQDLKKYFQADASNFQEGKAKLLESVGYLPKRYFFTMVRPNLDEIHNWPLPEGIEVRPVSPEAYRAIWKCVDETSQDEWGYTKATEEDYQEWLNDPQFQPDLWQIAWDTATGQVAGQVLTFINHEENQQFGRKRGYTEGIGVAKAWRRRGLARALIARSLQAQKTAGMIESALVADSENKSGATRLYESCGFHVIRYSMIYRKRL